MGSVGTISLPAIPVASRVMIGATGTIGYTAIAPVNLGLNITASAGTLTSAQANQQVRVAEAANWYDYGYSGYLDLPANTASTITVTLSAVGGNGYWKGQVVCRVHLPGEY